MKIACDSEESCMNVSFHGNKLSDSIFQTLTDFLHTKTICDLEATRGQSENELQFALEIDTIVSYVELSPYYCN